MPLTPDFDPDSCVITISPGIVTVDAAMYFVGILRKEWKANFTDGVRPIVDVNEAMKTVRFGAGDDAITVYSEDNPSKPVANGYLFVNETTTISLDFWTSGDRIHYKKFVQEARRIIHLYRKDPFGMDKGLSGRMWMEWATRNNGFEKGGKGFYRRVIDCTLNWRFRAV